MNTITTSANMPQRESLVGVFVAALLMALAGCSGSSDEPPLAQSTSEQVATIMNATPNPVTPEQVAEAFALGSHFTDLQRDLIKKDLVGSVVEWDIQVYEVSYANARYKVTSQPIPIKSVDALQLVRIAALVQARDPADDELLQKVMTNDKLRIRGLVQDITLRTVVTINPAVVSRNLPSSLTVIRH